MYLGFYSFYKHYNRNRMLDDPAGPIGDDIMYGFYYAGQRLRELGHRVATLDMDELEKFDAAIFFDHPTFLDPYYRRLRRMQGKKLYLFLFENPANRPDEYWRWNLRAFDKVFTWNPQLVDGKKFFQFWYSMRVPSPFQINRAEKNKFCVTIASQKYNPHPRELYSERVRAIRWFEARAPGGAGPLRAGLGPALFHRRAGAPESAAAQDLSACFPHSLHLPPVPVLERGRCRARTRSCASTGSRSATKTRCFPAMSPRRFLTVFSPGACPSIGARRT